MLQTLPLLPLLGAGLRIAESGIEIVQLSRQFAHLSLADFALLLLTPMPFQRVESFSVVSPVVDDGLDAGRHLLRVIRPRGDAPNVGQLARSEHDSLSSPVAGKPGVDGKLENAGARRMLVPSVAGLHFDHLHQRTDLRLELQVKRRSYRRLNGLWSLRPSDRSPASASALSLSSSGRRDMTGQVRRMAPPRSNPKSKSCSLRRQAVETAN
jgi:hypothetical protein